MSKEPGMHLPVFSLFTGAVGRLGRLEGLFVDGFNRKVAEDIFDLACLNIISLDLGHRLPEVPSTKGSLVIRKLDQGQLSILVPFKGIISDI